MARGNATAWGSKDMAMVTKRKASSIVDYAQRSERQQAQVLCNEVSAGTFMSYNGQQAASWAE